LNLIHEIFGNYSLPIKCAIVKLANLTLL